MAKRKWVKPPPLTMREMVRNSIRSYPHEIGYTAGKHFPTTLNSIYFFAHGNKEDINNELAKWIDLDGVELYSNSFA